MKSKLLQLSCFVIANWIDMMSQKVASTRTTYPDKRFVAILKSQ